MDPISFLYSPVKSLIESLSQTRKERMQKEEEPEAPQPVLSLFLEQLDANPYASRLESTSLTDLVFSMKNHGQLSPIRVRRSSLDSSRFQIVFGHRRAAAAKILEWKKITAQLVEASDEQMLHIALAENIDRTDFTDYEIGLALRKMKDQFNKSLEEIASLIGKSVSYASEHIKLTHLFDLVNESSSEINLVLQRVSIRQSRILLREPDALTRYRLARFCMTERVGEHEMSRLVGHPRTKKHVEDGFGQVIVRNSKRDEFAIRQLLEECIRGLNNRDVRTQFGIRDPKTFSMFDDFPPFGLLDFDNAVEHLYGYYKKFEEFHLDYDSLQVKVVGNAAYAAFLVTYRLRIDGKAGVGRSRATFVFSKLNGKWQSIHEHWSPYNSGFVTERLIKPHIEIL
jgi:ParB/RepB/Spo0J family partition protein